MAESIQKTNPECRLGVHSFYSLCGGKQVHFSVLKLNGSFMLWIGTKPAEMANLSMAMKTKYVSVMC